MTNRKSIKIAIIGTNTISDKVIRGGLEDPRFELYAVYSRNQDTADAFAQKHNIPYTFTDLDELAKNKEVEAVYIASPNAFHAPQSIKMMQAGKHVLCEKPLASNTKEAEQMFGVAQENGVILMEAMKPTLTPNFIKTLEAVEDIGTIRNYFSCYCQYSSRYDAFKQGDIMNAFKAELSNGALVDIGVYTIYPLIVLFGEPKSVKAIGHKLHTGVDGAGSVLLEYDQMQAQVLYSKIADSNLPTEIQGEEGSIILDRINIISTVTKRTRRGIEEDLTILPTHDEYFYEVAEFMNRIQCSSVLQHRINTPEQSLQTLRVLDEIRRQIGVIYPADEE